MPGQNETGVITCTAGAAIAPYLRVKLVAGVLQVAVAADRELGTLEERALAANDNVAVRLRNHPGTRKMVADAAVAAGADVFTRAAGKVGATSTGAFRVGVALTAAAADGEVIEVATDPASNAQP